MYHKILLLESDKQAISFIAFHSCLSPQGDDQAGDKYAVVQIVLSQQGDDQAGDKYAVVHIVLSPQGDDQAISVYLLSIGLSL